MWSQTSQNFQQWSNHQLITAGQRLKFYFLYKKLQYLYSCCKISPEICLQVFINCCLCHSKDRVMWCDIKITICDDGMPCQPARENLDNEVKTGAVDSHQWFDDPLSVQHQILILNFSQNTTVNNQHDQISAKYSLVFRLVVFQHEEYTSCDINIQTS